MQHVSHQALTRPPGQALTSISSQAFPYVKLKLLLFFCCLFCLASSQFPLLQTRVGRESSYFVLFHHTHFQEGTTPTLTNSPNYPSLQHLFTEMHEF